jgi:hypothetical protein
MRSTLWLGVVAVLSSTASFAQEPKVDVSARVVLASNQGSEIQPPALKKMKEEFARSGITFSSWRQLSAQTVSLEKGKVSEVPLPDGRRAQMRLQKLAEGTATVRVTIPKLVDTEYNLGRTGSVYIRSGDYQDGALILVLSPPSADSKIRPELQRRSPAPIVPAAAAAQ